MKNNEAVIVKAILNGWKIISDPSDGIMYIGGIPLKQETVDGLINQGYITKQIQETKVVYVTTKTGRSEANKFPSPPKYNYVYKAPPQDPKFGVSIPAPASKQVEKYQQKLHNSNRASSR